MRLSVLSDAPPVPRDAPSNPALPQRADSDAGHGVQIDGRNYFFPIDVELKADTSMTAAMIDMDTIMAGLDDHVRTNILIFDACRNNPMAPQVVSAAAGRGI